MYSYWTWKISVALMEETPAPTGVYKNLAIESETTYPPLQDFFRQHFVYSRTLVHLPGGHAGNFTSTLRHGDSSTVAGWDCRKELIGWMNMDPYRIHVTLDPISMTMKTQLWRVGEGHFLLQDALFVLLASILFQEKSQGHQVFRQMWNSGSLGNAYVCRSSSCEKIGA